MNKNFIRVAIVSFLSWVMYTLNIFPNELVLSTLFTVASIFLSIGLSIIITFDLSIIKNDRFYLIIKNNIDNVRKLFLIYFAIMTCSYLVGVQFIKKDPHIVLIDFNLISFCVDIPNVVVSIASSLLLFGICCFIINFIDLQKLKNDIDSKHRNENIRSEK